MQSDQSVLDAWHMRRALELAVQGEGYVEPNPMVGCVIVQGAEIIGEGWHRRFGEAHAEVEALKLAGSRAAGATLYVTLEPCCHQGKTPPCTQALIRAGIRRVVIAQGDPFPQVDGCGLTQLKAAGIAVEVGLLEAEARRLNAPYLKLLRCGRPWVIAKWAMTLDGKIATRTGSSQWISNPQSRAIVHRLRGRVDAIIVGRETARRDDPLLTARPPGPRTALRIVTDTRGTLASLSQLVRTAREVPLMVAVGGDVPERESKRLQLSGCEVLVCEGETHATRLASLLDELGRRRLTNVLVEGGSRILGTLLDSGEIDEVHTFIAPRLVGGAATAGPTAGEGVAQMSDAVLLESPDVQQIDDDIYVHGRVARKSSTS
jgi:diaminohydroxyphosphoribosylaminopyrimidine deaminase/5-amino-6-(5-phosphoribosylamino)uracil reductase